MAISQFLIGLPIVILMVSIGIQGGNFQGIHPGVVICNPNAVVGLTCSISSDGKTTTFQCAGPNSCKIGDNCPFGGPPPPSFCAAGFPRAVWMLPGGTSLTVLTPTSSSSSSFFFGFGTIGPSGFIAIIGIIVGVVALAGLTVFGSGTSAESIHILFMGGLMLGIWIFLSGLEGFLGNAKTSVFTQLNGPLTSPGGTGFGTEFYILLTLMYLFGFMGMVKRGGI